jgi:hypothetical protein
MENFFQSVYQAILRLIPFQTLKAIVIASPGFTKESVCPPPCPYSNLTNVAIRLHIPSSDLDIQQTPPSIPDEMDQSPLQYFPRPLSRRGHASSGNK